MTMEVSKLLLRAVLDTSGLASGSSTPKRPGPLALATTLSLKPENSTKPVDTSSQVRAPDDMEMDDPTQEEICTSPSPPVKTLGPSSEASSPGVTQLQEEANKAMGCLLATRSPIDAHQRKQVSDFGMALCQNESETTKAIKEAKALCAHTIWDAETHQTLLISKAKVWHATLIKEIGDGCTHALVEAENTCSTAIWDAESWGTSQAHSIQQSHFKDIQCLEVDAIEEEGRHHLAFLATCSTTLRASPPKAHGIMLAPFHLLLGMLLCLPYWDWIGTGRLFNCYTWYTPPHWHGPIQKTRCPSSWGTHILSLFLHLAQAPVM